MPQNKNNNGAGIAVFAGALFLGAIAAMATTNTPLLMEALTQGLNPTANDGVNNPLNLRVSNNAWDGKIPPVPGQQFERFQTMWQGFRAGMINFRSIVKSGKNTLMTAIATWAPSSDGNQPTAYANGVGVYTGIDPDTDLTTLVDDGTTMQNIIAGMTAVEQGANFKLNSADLQQAWANV